MPRVNLLCGILVPICCGYPGHRCGRLIESSPIATVRHGEGGISHGNCGECAAVAFRLSLDLPLVSRDELMNLYTDTVMRDGGSLHCIACGDPLPITEPLVSEPESHGYRCEACRDNGTVARVTAADVFGENARTR